MATQNADVIVVGAGNAAFCAALAAQEQGAKVLMLEAAPEEESGGNSRFTAGSIRVVYNGVEVPMTDRNTALAERKRIGVPDAACVAHGRNVIDVDAEADGVMRRHRHSG